LHTLPSRETFAIKSNQSASKFAPKTKTLTWPRRPRPGVAGQTESGKSSTSEGNRVPSRPPEPRTQSPASTRPYGNTLPLTGPENPVHILPSGWWRWHPRLRRHPADCNWSAPAVDLW